MLNLAFLISLISLSAITYHYYRATTREKVKNQSLLTSLDMAAKQIGTLQHDITELQKEVTLATTDPVTQLTAWQLFVNQVQNQLNESARFQFTLAMLSIEIIDWSLYADVMEAASLEKILREVADRFKTCIRQIDAISHASNNHFYILLTKLAKPEMAAIVAQRLFQALQKPVVIDHQDIYLQVRVGISVYPVDGDSAASLFDKAEQALLVAANKRGQQFQFYQENIHQHSQRELLLVMGMRGDTLFDELEMQYETIFNKKTDTLICVQALPCWRHPELGVIEVDSLLKRADKQGRSADLLEWMVLKATEHYAAHAEWFQQGVLIGLPILLHHLKGGQFIHRLTQLLQEARLPANKLLLNLIDDGEVEFESIEKSVNMLRYLNVQLGMQDFDQARVSMQQWRQLNLRYIFMSPTLLADLPGDDQQRALVQALIHLARAMCAQVVFSGGCCDEEWRALSAMGGELVYG